MEEIKIENLTFAYPQRSFPAICNINLSINPGEFVVLCGRSGCGKSTLLRCLKPIISPHGKRSGVVLFEGSDIKELSQRVQAEKIGFVLQNPDNQIVCDKVWHELAFGLESLAYPTEEIRVRVAEMASYFGIQNWYHKNVSELSGGEKQLLNLAAVMVMQPSVLILDEPTSQLDPIASHDFLQTVSRINKELGTTVILSEHRLEEAFPLADRVVVMENGKIFAQGTPEEVGRSLAESGSDMLAALPTPMRVYFASGSTLPCPVTVRDGRKWLSQTEMSGNISFEDREQERGDAAVTVKDVWFRYEKNLPDVLKGLTFTVDEGEFYAIVGGNGAGKTTAMSVICGINKPYCGQVSVADGKRVAALPQNPQDLFSRKTIRLDLADAAGEKDDSRVERVMEFCGLDSLADMHPYDLSGGEQQRAALAMVLLQDPDILILDEPTKGLDANFKVKLAGLIAQLKKSGVTVIAVSHDIEFCAKYADRCAMFFDGQIVSEDAPRRFFAGKSFYTTAANRMARQHIKGVVLDSDILTAIGKLPETQTEKEPAEALSLPKTVPRQKEPKRLTRKNYIFGAVFAVLFVLAIYSYFKTGSVAIEMLIIVFAAAAGMNLIPKREFGAKNIQTAKTKRKVPKRTLAAAVMILLLIPLTVFVGVVYLGDKKYYFISLLIIFETMLPFAMVFEGRKPQARELIIISVLCAIGVAGRAAFAPLPQFKPVVAVVIIAGICFGGEAGFLVGAITGFVSDCFFGQGPWTPWQMFSFGIIGFIAGILFRKGILRKTKIELCIFGFLATLIIYGGIMNPASVIMWQPNPTRQMIAASYIMGLPFDLVHALATAFFLWFGAEPMCEKLDRVKVKYGLIDSLDD
ncbi:MAG: ATP-binding cassette domain-containing protein [Firmicutes bacterium]|nr:ATP-binding cassette domain-containing protein [Bacillota bacterium]